MEKRFQSQKNKFLFGSTSAIITNLALVVGLEPSINAKLNIVASILVIAIADNISDTLGIHIYQEAEGLKEKEVWLYSLTNFITRFLVSMIFILLVLLLPLRLAVISSIIFGLLILTIISYTIALHKKMNPYKAIIGHIIIALLTLLLSNFLGKWVVNKLHY
jgi:VIT1/CCC1 family predicted Fe2+/Mn2+ transporter